MLKKLIRFPIQLFLFVVFLSTLLLGLAQFQIVKDKIRDILLSKLSDGINGEVFIGQISGNLINQIEITGIIVKNKNEFLLTADRAVIKFNPFALLSNNLSLDEFTLYKPNINLRRDSDTSWNFENFTKQKDTSQSTAEWILSLKGVEIKDGNLYYDSRSPDSKYLKDYQYADFKYFTLSELNLSLSTLINSDSKWININHMSFCLENRYFLNNLAASIYIDKKGALIDTLEVEFNNSRLGLTAFLKDVNLLKDDLSLEKLRKKPVLLNLNSENLNFSDLKYFIPALKFLEGNFHFNIYAEGDFEKLNINDIGLKFNQSDMHINGSVANLYSPEHLFINADVSSKNLVYNEINSTLYGLNLPEFSNIGSVKLLIKYEGNPNDFHSIIDLEGDVGMVTGNVSLNLKPDIPKYEVDLNTKNLDLKSIIGNAFASRINSSIKGKGSGFDIKSTNSDFEITIDSSRIINQPIDKSRFSVTIINKHVNSYFALSGGSTKIGMNSEFDFNKESEQYYNFNLNLENFDFSRFTGSTEHQTNLNLSTSLQGKDLDYDKTSGRMNLFIFPSSYNEKQIQRSNLLLNFDQSNPNSKSLTLRSEILDFEIGGRFSLKSIIPDINKRLNRIKKDISEIFIFPEKKYETVKNPSDLENNIIEIQDSLDFHYNLICKDLNLLKQFGEFKDITAQFRLTGDVLSDKTHIRMNGEVNIENLFMLSTDQNILIQDAKCNFDIYTSEGERLLYNMKNIINLSVPSIYIGKTQLKNTNLGLITQNNKSNLALKTNVDSIIDIKMLSAINLTDSIHTLTFDSLTFELNKYRWNNKEKIICYLKQDGLEIESFDLSHGKEELYLQGNISKSGEQNLNVIINNLLIENIISASFGKKHDANPLLAGKINLICEIFGTATEPLINIKLGADSLLMNNKYFGRLFGKINYEDGAIYSNVQFKSSESILSKKSDLLLVGYIPINLAFSSEEKLFPGDEEIDLSLITDKMPMNFIGLLIPDIKNFEGTSDANIHIYGKGEAPEFEGYVKLNRSSFTLNANGMKYLTYGDIITGDEDVKIDLNIENLPSDRKDGKVNIKGNAIFESLKLKNVNLSANGQLQIMQEKYKRSNNQIHGDLLVAISPTGMKYNLDLADNPKNLISGSVIIKEGNLTFPQSEKSEEVSESTSDFTYIVIDDTTRKESDSVRIRRERYLSQFVQHIEEVSEQSSSRSVFGNIDYNIEIKTLADVKVEMIFNALLNEELVGEIGGSMTLVKERKGSALYGSLNIGEKSSYRFTGKKFDASGKIIFTGNISNPELDIIAKYQGTHINKENLSNPKEEKVVITLTITGTKEKPNLVFDLLVDGKPRKQGDVESDVFAFILSGYFNDELTSDQKQNIASNYNFESSFFSIGSGVISGRLTEFFKNEFEFIKSVETDFKAGDLTRTNLKISGEIGKTAVFHLGGRVFNDIGNTNVTLELPIGKILNNELLRNMVIEIYRNTSENNKTLEPKETPYYGTRLVYRITF